MPFDGDITIHEPKVTQDFSYLGTPILAPYLPGERKQQRAYDTIMRAAALIESGIHWARGTFAARRHYEYNLPTSMDDPRADAFCAVGALLKMGLTNDEAAEIDIHVARMTGKTLMNHNDVSNTPDRVVRLMRKVAQDVGRGDLVL